MSQDGWLEKSPLPDSSQELEGGSNQSVKNNKQPSFFHCPILDQIFIKSPPNHKKSSTCMACNTEYKTQEINRLLKHAINCSKVNEDIKYIISQEINRRNPEFSHHNFGPDTQSMNFILTKMLIKNDLAFSLTECPYFQFLLKQARQMRVEWKLPTRRQLTENYLSSVNRAVIGKYKSLISGCQDYSISIEFDLWEDARSRSIMAVVLTFGDGSKHLLSLKDLSDVRHTGEIIHRELQRSLEGIPLTKLNSIVSDSASNCKVARRLLLSSSDFSHLIQHRCFAHNLNLMGKKLTASPAFSIYIFWAMQLRAVVTGNRVLAAKFTNAGINRIPKPLEVRWYSHINILEMLEKSGQKILEVIDSESDTQDEIFQKFRDDKFMSNLRLCISILRPLCNCIAIAERDDGTIGETFNAILVYCKSIAVADWSNEFIAAAIEAFILYFGPAKLDGEFGLILTAYFLDRRFMRNFVTDAGIEFIFKTITSLATKSGLSSAATMDILSAEFLDYCEQSGDFNEHQDESKKAVDWWRSRREVPGFLRLIALRLANLKSSSANTERCFSNLKNIQTIKRTQLTIEHMLQIEQIKLSLKSCPENEFHNDISEASPRNKRPRLDTPETQVIGLNSASQETISLSSQESIRDQPSSLNSSISSIDSDSFYAPPDEETCSYRIPEDTTQLSSVELMCQWGKFKEYIDFNLIKELSPPLVVANPDNINLEEINRRFAQNLSQRRTNRNLQMN